MGTLQINILDTSFTIQSTEDTEYLKKLLGYYERISDQIKNSGILKNPTQVAIMTGLMLCDELYKEKSNKLVQNSNGQVYYESDDEYDDELERRTLEMIQKISQVVGEDETDTDIETDETNGEINPEDEDDDFELSGRID